MELRQLEIFVAVAEESHFGRAADRLFIGQPAVSQQVARLERELGTQLFDRSSRRVALTATGRAFLERAREVLNAAERARRLTDTNPEEPEVLSLGTCSGLGEHLRRVLARLTELNADLHLDLVSASVPDRLRFVQSGRLDAAFSHAEPDLPDLSATLVWEDELVLCLPAQHDLARQDDVDLADLEALPLRLSSRRANPVLYETVFRGCRAAGFEPRLGPTSVSLEDNLTAISAGPTSWTVVYGSHARLLQTRDVVFRPVRATGTGGTQLRVNTYVVVNARQPSPHAGLVLAACGTRADASPQDLVSAQLAE